LTIGDSEVPDEACLRGLILGLEQYVEDPDGGLLHGELLYQLCPSFVCDQGVVACLRAAWRIRYDFPGLGPGETLSPQAELRPPTEGASTWI
jgi:hypothetical protein